MSTYQGQGQVTTPNRYCVVRLPILALNTCLWHASLLVVISISWGKSFPPASPHHKLNGKWKNIYVVPWTLMDHCLSHWGIIFILLIIHLNICRFRIDATVLLIKFLPSLPVTAERGSAPSAHYPPERATSGIATCSVVGDTYRPVAKLSPALGWWTLPCLACLWARIRARPTKQSTGWRNTVTNV